MQINQECIKKIYESHELVTDAHIDSRGESEFLIFLFHYNNLITETAIVLKFKDNELLLPYIEEKGNVVKIEVFILRKEFRRKGICKSIHKKEVQFYKEHNIQQMQLEATYSGFFAWSKLGFSYSNNDEKSKKNCNCLFGSKRHRTRGIFISSKFVKFIE